MNNVQLRVGDLLYAAFKRWKMILALGLLGFICGFALSGVSYLQGNYTSYEISCSIAITSQSSTGAFTNNSSYLSTNDFHLAEDMVDAASFVMKSNRVLQAALDSTGLVSVSTKDVYQNLEVSRYNETQVLQLTLSWNNADAGIRLMNAILDASRTHPAGDADGGLGGGHRRPGGKVSDGWRQLCQPLDASSACWA